MTRFLCATAARERLDPLIGTTAPARRWLLVEYGAPWGHAALDSGVLAGPVGAALHRSALDTGSRVLLIRRSGRRGVGGRRSWFLVENGGGTRCGTWEDPVELLAPAGQLAAPVVPDQATPPGPVVPLLLVCTHGLHDVCCAVRGRPVAAALARRWPEQTWECSHLGGDRFAASLLVVPDGTCYGYLDADSAPGVVERHLEGVVDLPHLRGFAGYSPVVQTALAAVLEGQDGQGPQYLRPVAVNSAGVDAWRVTVRHPVEPEGDVEVEVLVTRSVRPPAQLTCSAEGDSAAYVHRAVWVRPVA